MKRRRGKGTGHVAHLLLMSCESFANCLQVATKSGILSRSWLTCSSTATNCVSVRCVGWWWEVEWGGSGRCVGWQWEVCGVVVEGVWDDSGRCVGWWWEVERGCGGRCMGRWWEVCGVMVGGVEGKENSQYLQ